jgi:hypothetical protein
MDCSRDETGAPRGSSPTLAAFSDAPERPRASCQHCDPTALNRDGAGFEFILINHDVFAFRDHVPMHGDLAADDS